MALAMASLARTVPIPKFLPVSQGREDSPISENDPNSALQAPYSTPIQHVPNSSEEDPLGGTPTGIPTPITPATPTETEPVSRSKKWIKKKVFHTGKGASSSVPKHRFLRSFKPNIVLRNSGSVARDHLASERTYLSYVRTSLALATTGVALVQLFAIASGTQGPDRGLHRLTRFARPLGATLIIFGLLVLLSGVRRYFTVQFALTQGNFPLTRVEITGIALVLAVIIIIVFSVLVSLGG